MTKSSNRLGIYADVRQVLDQALAHGGGSFECPSHGDAVHWRQRAYRFRKLYAEVLGPKTESPYDILVLPRIDPGSGVVQIEVRQVGGIFRPAGPRIEPVEDAALFEEAQALLDKLGDGA